MELQPGAILKVDKDLVEYVGIQDSSKNPKEVKIVGRLNPEQPAKDGAIHRLFSPDQLEKDAVKVGSFGEAYPYSEYVKERDVWQDLLGKDLEVPHPPKELITVLARAREQGITSFEPHYLPPVTLARDDLELNGKKYPYPQNWKQFNTWFWLKDARERTSPHTLTLSGNWILIDVTPKPEYYTSEHGQMYPNDPFKHLIETLQANRMIHGSIHSGSRFDLSYDEINAIVMPEIAKVLGARNVMTRIPTAEEVNVLFNMFHPEFGETRSTEWYSNIFGGNMAIIGGNKEKGGLSYAGVQPVNGAHRQLGFRPIVVFPQEVV